MTTKTTFHESLPYIDPEPTQEERAAAETLIAAELSATAPHPPPTDALPPLRDPSFTPALQSELDRVSRKEPLEAIDLSRYEAQEIPPRSADDDPAATNALLAATLRKAYASSSYLTSRLSNLHLLDRWGRNAWLIGNHGLEAELRSLEKELADTRAQIDVLTVARQRAQGDVAGEMASLSDAWRKGVGRVLETEVAIESMRREILVEMGRHAQLGAA